ncbi:MAG: M48 family metalloprotease, partial [Deltaproteobacteria bacterium]|nr:M48 family metalloprotease [Deltaproteobacteria bacterium]
MKAKSIRIKSIIVLIASTTFLASLFYFGESKAFSLSIEEEQILGKKFLANMRRHFDLVDDDFANEYMNDLGHYLIKPLETKHFPYRFYIIKNNKLNAFAGPGGHIFFFSGLIEVMEEVDELASVICHEIGHISARHISQRVEQNKKIGLATMAGILAGVLIGGEAAGAITTGAVAAGVQKQLSYSRNDERHADQLGFKYTVEAGFDPSGMITILKKLHQGQYSGADGIPPYLLTHPGGPERMSNIDIMLTNHNRKPETNQTKKFRDLFPFFKIVLRAKYLD